MLYKIVYTCATDHLTGISQKHCPGRKLCLVLSRLVSFCLDRTTLVRYIWMVCNIINHVYTLEKYGKEAAFQSFNKQMATHWVNGNKFK